jgi:hypothetical protein
VTSHAATRVADIDRISTEQFPVASAPTMSAAEYSQSCSDSITSFCSLPDNVKSSLQRNVGDCEMQYGLALSVNPASNVFLKLCTNGKVCLVPCRRQKAKIQQPQLTVAPHEMRQLQVRSLVKT